MRARKTKSFQNLSFRNDFNIKTSKTQWFFKKNVKISSRARPKNVTNCCVSLVCIICLIYHMDYIQQMHVPLIVATVVRTPRSEVSQRHRAGSWVWVVAKIPLGIW